MATPLPDVEIIQGQYLLDGERSAFGLGYEYCRRGTPIQTMPIFDAVWKEEEFRAGWRAREAWVIRRRANQ
jgi:hypothetical protein